MKKHKLITLVISVLVTVSACSSTKQPDVINHSKPDLKIETTWIESAGCQLQEVSPGYFSASCQADSALRQLGCEYITAKYLFGGLPYPVVLCENYHDEVSEPAFTKVGCYLSTRNEALLININGVYQLVDDKDLQSIVAPIESADEALSYVIATTDYYAMYDLELEKHSHYYVNKIEETYVRETPTGYLVHLFYFQEPFCGCGKHYVNAVDILVHTDGSTKLVKSRHFYSFSGCVD